ncbi:MAG: hypothetical protein DRH30_08705 [Deltaproteobacteria bacterium]|nr:MAG: hypothetical protein DRH30_08705 [Deltaproteobacteria bacterium]
MQPSKAMKVSMNGVLFPAVPQIIRFTCFGGAIRAAHPTTNVLWKKVTPHESCRCPGGQSDGN